jgi:hypothetical protein
MADDRYPCKLLGFRGPVPCLHHQVIATATPRVWVRPIIGVEETKPRPADQVLADEGCVPLTVFLALDPGGSLGHAGTSFAEDRK